ncbi:MAG TPA: tetratricopeptide repeat protein [Noviherbaspirillum sp.]|nr:tetratricopeptide repeat protein [Noviherbaspirillum sp.]
MDSSFDAARQHFFTGIEHFEAGRLEPACAAFATAAALAPGRPSVLGNLGITLFQLGRIDEAVAPLRQATAADPAYAEAWACLGLAEEARGRWQEAADALEQALRLAPDRAPLWMSLALCRQRLGQAGPALDAFGRALAADPAYADAWSARGSLLRELGRLAEAAQCFEQALACGGDPELNRYYLASVQEAGLPPAPPRRYVESLFDEYAPEFQGHVTGALRYQGHEVLLRPLLQAGRRYPRVLDLGCGTGLCGTLIAPAADAIVGVDLSQAMLEEARKSGVYRELVHADVASFLAGERSPVDLVVAADVFIYVGALDAVFGAVRRILAPGGCFAFTVEEPVEDGGMQLLPSLRYAHSEQYVRDLAQRNGFEVDAMSRAPIRHDQERPVGGLYVYLR